jgi:cytochrome c oxidase cbb3-type subunit 3
MQDVSNYIASLAGTNPPNAKTPQGDKIAADSTATN